MYNLYIIYIYFIYTLYMNFMHNLSDFKIVKFWTKLKLEKLESKRWNPKTETLNNTVIEHGFKKKGKWKRVGCGKKVMMILVMAPTDLSLYDLLPPCTFSYQPKAIESGATLIWQRLTLPFLRIFVTDTYCGFELLEFHS